MYMRIPYAATVAATPQEVFYMGIPCQPSQLPKSVSALAVCTVSIIRWGRRIKVDVAAGAVFRFFGRPAGLGCLGLLGCLGWAADLCFPEGSQIAV